MLSVSDPPQWKGSLSRLRAAGCPSLEPVLRGGMPQKAILVLDHNAINDVLASTMEALTGAGFENDLIVPELALDFFDQNAKSSSKIAFNARANLSSSDASAPSSPLLPKEFIAHDKLQQKKGVLLKKGTYRVTVQRVNEYDMSLLQTLNISAHSYDTRLYVLCALYFKQLRKRPTVVVTSDPVVIDLAKQYNILTCPAEDICICGSLIAQDAAKRNAPPPPPPACAPRQGGQRPSSAAKPKVGATPAASTKAPKKGKKR